MNVHVAFMDLVTVNDVSTPSLSARLSTRVLFPVTIVWPHAKRLNTPRPCSATYHPGNSDHGSFGVRRNRTNSTQGLLEYEGADE